MPIYEGSWLERHTVTIEAENEDEAMDKMHEGDYESDDGTEFEGELEIHEIKK